MSVALKSLKYVDIKFQTVISNLIKKSPSQIFLILGVVFGLGFLIMNPPMQSPDEVEHFYRSYQVSDGNINSVRLYDVGHGDVGEGYGGYLPESIIEVAELFKGNVAGSARKFDYSVYSKSVQINLQREKTQPIRFDNTTIYSMIPYVPQATGINIGKLFNLKPTYLIYLGRIANLIFWLIIIYIAIRLTPIGKWAFVAVALNPVSVFLATTLSADVFMIAVVALFVSLILHLRSDSEILSNKQITLLVVFSLTIALLKNAYLPLVFLIFAIPSKRLHVYQKITVVIASIMVGLLWNIMSINAAQTIPQYFGMNDTINSTSQVENIISNPLRAVVILLWNTLGTPSLLIPQSYNKIIGWGDVPLPFWISIISFFAIAVSLLKKDNKISNKIIQTKNIRLLFGLIFFICMAAIILSLYVGWTEVGSRLVSGVQGRYYIPITFLMIPALVNTGVWISSNKGSFEKLMTGLLFTSLLVSISILSLRYTVGIWW